MRADSAPGASETSDTHRSFWSRALHPITTEPLARDTRAEVVIVGGGIAGVSIAYQLLRAGRGVVLVDDGALGSGETGRTSAHLVNALDDRFTHLIEVFGEAGRLTTPNYHPPTDNSQLSTHNYFLPFPIQPRCVWWKLSPNLRP